MLVRILALLLTAAYAVLADLAVTSPAGGATVANTAVSVVLSGASGMNVLVQVLVGGSTEATSSIIYSSPAAVAYSGAIAVTVPAATGPLATYAAYYLKITGTPTAGGAASIAYSQRFTMSGMSGAFASTAIETAAKQAAAQGVTAVPANVAGAAAGAAASSVPSGSVIAFSLQTGLIKYAPMQGKPGSTVTATNTARLYPTSAWSIFTTNAPIPSQTHTVTPSAVYSVSSRENPASAAPQPSNDMAKFLARWVD